MNSKNEKQTPNIFLSVIKKIFKTLGSFLATFAMVGVITGCIVGSILTVYVLQSLSAEDPIDLDAVELGYATKIYVTDQDTGQPKEIQQLYTSESNRIPVAYEDISPNVRNAIIAVEDKRFMEHPGVDWRRSIAALLAYLNIGSTRGGGSTIHQQLIKNITGDDAYRVDRKVQEVFRAIHLAQDYSKERVLEAYLNVVPFGAGTNGIESAAQTYFGKSASDLSLAESASIVGITQYPGLYNPFVNPAKNKERQIYVLSEMLKQGMITQEEHDQAVEAPLNFQKKQHAERLSVTQSYFVDHVIEEVIDGLMDKFDYERAEAARDLYGSGYHIYATVDERIQTILEDYYVDVDNFPKVLVGGKEYPQSAAVILDPHSGEIKGLVGGRGEKRSARTFNRATMGKRSPGSTFKPIGPYALAFEYDRLYWSTVIEDSPINPDEPEHEWYPRNYYEEYLGSVDVAYAIARSVNTVAVKVGQLVTPQSIYDFLYNDLEIHSLVETDIDIAPMALGSTTYGVTPLELAGAFQMFANGGYYITPHAFTHVLDSDGKIVLEANATPRRVLSEDTAVLMNKLLQGVVTGAGGTAHTAQIPGMPTAGKTGTSDKNLDQWFVGFTPYYVCEVWLGYDRPNTYDQYGNTIPNSILYNQFPTPYLFRDLMTPIHEGLEPKAFMESDNLTQEAYCTITGNLLGPDCPSSKVGWYKLTRMPPICTGPHAVAEEDVGDDANDTGDAPEEITAPSGDGNTPDGNVNPPPQ